MSNAKLLMRIELWRNALGRWIDAKSPQGALALLKMRDEMTATLREANAELPRYRQEAQEHLDEIGWWPDIGGPYNNE